MLVGAWSAMVWMTGGFRYQLFGTFRLSSTNASRSSLFALALFVLYLAQSPRAFLQDVRRAMHPRHARGAAIAATIAMFCVAMLWGITVVGGADAYGYVSEASLLRHRTASLAVQSADHVPWPDATWTQSPLGYRPASNARDRLVPTYAAGLPLAMALLQILFGYGGAFLVVPLCSALLVWLTFLLARRLFDSPGVGLASALLLATSPAFLFEAFWPMSDVPVATAWTAALVLFVYDSPLAAGLAMSAAIAIRPNLLLLPALAFLWTAAADYRERQLFGRTLRAGLGLIPGVAWVALFQWQVYGSPLESGYGNIGYLFSTHYATTNIANYWNWLIDTETPVVVIAALGLAAPRWCGVQTPRARLLCGGTLAATIGSYLFYMPFEEWWYLRFLLPAFPLVLSLTMGGVDALLRRGVPRFRTAAMTTLVVVLIVHGVGFANARHGFEMGRAERRYVDVARFVDRYTEPDAVFLTMQHSSSLRHYAGRLTLRYDILSPDWLDRTVDYLESIGRHPYLVLEDWEVESFKHRFAGHSALAQLDWAPLGRLDGWNNVAVYDLGPTRMRHVPMIIPTSEIDRATGWPVPPPYHTPPDPCLNASCRPTATRPAVPQSPTGGAGPVPSAEGE